MNYSIIIPCYNVEAYIEECLSSIYRIMDAKQTEVILVDDGSSDQTVSIVEAYIKDKSNFTLLCNPHLGVSMARNAALQKARGKYIVFVDSDDVLMENYFEVVEQHLCDEVDILHFNYINFNEHKRWKNKEQLPFLGSGKEFLNTALLQDKYSTAICMHIFKRQFFLDHKIQFVQDIYHEDEEFNIQCLLKDCTIKSINDYIYLYRIHSTSITQNVKLSKQRTESKFYIYEKYMRYENEDKVYRTLSTYLSIMILLEISKYPLNSNEFKELKKLYKKRGMIHSIKTDLWLYRVLKGLYRVNDTLVYIALKLIKKIKK